MKLGADDYITKPFSSAYLKARIFNLLEQRKKLQALYCACLLPHPPNNLAGKRKPPLGPFAQRPEIYDKVRKP
jgi:DNA-binding response OmpR family regulator